MKKFRKSMALILSLVFFSSVFCVSGNAVEPTEPIFTYHNSLIVNVTVDEEKILTSSDFPEVDCKAVYVIEKDKIVGGYNYTAVLVVEDPVCSFGDPISDAISAVKENEIVNDAKRNNAGQTLDGDLNEYITLVVGNSKEIDYINTSDVYCMVGVTFVIDNSIISDETIASNCFSDYGIVEIWPVDDAMLDENYWNDLFYQSELPNTAGTVSAHGVYCGRFSEDDIDHNLRLADIAKGVSDFAALDGVIEVFAVYEKVNYNGFLESEDTNIVSIIPPTDTTATVLYGASKGITTITVQEGINVAEYTITVVSPADVNGDDLLNSLDAAQILKYDAGIIDGSEWSEYGGYIKGDFNLDGKVDSLDAAQILRYDAGIINAGTCNNVMAT